MDPIEYLRAFRRRWSVLAWAVVVAVAAAWLTTTVVPVGPPVRTYQATAILLATGELDVPGISSLGTLARLTTIKPVAERVAEDLEYEGDPLSLTASVQASVDADAGWLTITAVSRDPNQAKKIADAFVRGLMGFLRDRKAETLAREQKYIRETMDELSTEIAKLDREIVASPLSEAEVLRAQRDAKVLTYSGLSQQLQTTVTRASSFTPLEILQDPSPRAVILGGFQPPRSRTSRVVWGGAIGLLVGVMLVLVLERLDTRIRTKAASERYFGLPVLSEIPVIPKSQARRQAIVTSTSPTSLAADSFRLLAAGLNSPSLNGAGGKRPSGEGSAVPVVMVTSPGRAEGKTTVVANLGAAFAEVGRRVLILSCDFRHATLHQLFGLQNGTGLADILRKRGNGRSMLDEHVQDTSLPGVRLVPSGSTPPRPSSLLSSPGMRQVLHEARTMGDVVLLDTPPILSASDAAHLVDEVDAVVVVARAGHTTFEQAGRAAELLRQLEAPVVGVALNASSEWRAAGRTGLVLPWFRSRNGAETGEASGIGLLELLRLPRRD